MGGRESGKIILLQTGASLLFMAEFGKDNSHVQCTCYSFQFSISFVKIPIFQMVNFTMLGRTIQAQFGLVQFFPQLKTEMYHIMYLIHMKMTDQPNTVRLGLVCVALILCMEQGCSKVEIESMLHL